MEFFTATRKLKKFFIFLQLDMFDVCTTGDTAHIDRIFKLMPHTCAVSPVVPTSNISSCKKIKNFFSFLVAVKNSIKVGPLGFLVINVCNHGEHYETPCMSYCCCWTCVSLCVLHAYFVSVYATATCLHITWSFVYKCESGSKCFCVISQIMLTIFHEHLDKHATWRCVK
jgi:hypothetical protein